MDVADELLTFQVNASSGTQDTVDKARLKRHSRIGMSDTGLTVSCIMDLLRRYDVTITVDREGGHLPNPAAFAVAADLAASGGAASVVSAHTASQIVSIVSVRAADQPAAVAVALAVVSDALKSPVGSSTR